MSSRLYDALSLLPAVIVLLIAHALHALTLILTLVLHLYASLQPGSKRLEASNLAIDIARWRKHKIPSCIALVFVPAARGRFIWRKGSYEPWAGETVLQGLLEDVVGLVSWCNTIKSIESLVLYDEKGILKRHSSQMLGALSTHFPKQDCCRISKFTLLVGSLRIALLDANDGKEHIARVGAGLAEAVQSGYLEESDITTELLQEKLQASLCAEPQLLMVLGGLHLRLRGFPPWHTRLCEIYHDSSLGLLGPPRLRYSAFRRAMDAYAGCEQRQGR